MKKQLLFFYGLFLMTACTNSDRNAKTPESDLDAASMFIRNALEGKFDAARQLMVKDTTNDNRMSDTERTYDHMKNEDKRNYREASIHIHDVRKVNDSTTIVTYSNSFKKTKDSVKVVRWNDQWLIDLKYTFQKTLAEYD